MKTWRGLLGVTVFAVGVGAAYAQTPVLGSIEAPYAALQSPVKIANTQWGPGAVAYGPANTPLVLHGLDLGGSGTVQFVAYKNGAVDTNVNPVQAAVTMWSPTMLFLTVPAGAMSGLVTVTSEGRTSNGLPFLVTPGTYSGSCPAGPTTTQLQITTASLPDGTVNQAYSLTLLASGGTTAYSWSITSGSLPSGLSLNASTGTISGTPTAASGPVDVTFQVTDSSSPSQHDRAVLSLTIEPKTLVAATVYSYTANSYDRVGNLTSYTDTVMGTWNMTAPGGGSGYDTLNRLMAANVTWPDSTQQIACWSYDAFGNRTMESLSSVACNANPTPTTWAQYNGTVNGTNNNQMSQTYQNTNQGNGYDPAGNVTFDGVNTYTYDAEGRICAVKSEPMPGMTAMTGYLYDADGTRVAKGTITSMSCDPTANGFQFTENYVLGPGGEELTMLDGNNNWQRTNVYAGGKLLATYDTTGLHFHLEDPLGTRRMQLAGNLPGSAYGCPIGQPETDIQSLPFGDQLNSYPDQYACSTADDSTPLHFTGKERDYESGNDYFGARYYASSMGRFMSPDWSAQVEPVPYAKLDNPQSLNLYAYALNNPLRIVDLDGHNPHCDTNGSCVTEVQIKQNVNFYNKDGSVFSTVSVTTNMDVISNSKGEITSVFASATATNVSGYAFSDKSLGTIGSTVGAVQQAGASMSLGTDSAHLLTAITAKESTLGLSDATNPMRLSRDSGTPPNGDRGHNIQGALNELRRDGVPRGFDPARTYGRYNGVGGAQQIENVNKFMQIYNGMSQSTMSWTPSVPAAPIPAGLQ